MTDPRLAALEKPKFSKSIETSYGHFWYFLRVIAIHFDFHDSAIKPLRPRLGGGTTKNLIVQSVIRDKDERLRLIADFMKKLNVQYVEGHKTPQKQIHTSTTQSKNFSGSTSSTFHSGRG
jgi:hypothetical protein